MELLHTILQNFNTNKLIKIAIDGYAAVGKTSVEEAIANQYGYQFIDSGLFYRYVSYYHNNYSIDQIKQIFDEEQILKLINSIKHLNKEQYQESGIRAAQISANNELRDIINETIRKIVKSKGFVVIGYDITTLCLPDAEVKIILSADVETRVARRAFQTNLKDYINIFNNILERDVISQSLIKQAYNVSYEIDTTKLTLSEVVDMILIQVFKKIL
ncbi:15472_t:CDS:1, partial [Cetraspora pellucida]